MERHNDPVTGATGHVGRAVVRRLASIGHDVVAMVWDVQAASGIVTGKEAACST